MPIVISDVSPLLNMLWCAADREGNRAVWWQDDFHHYNWWQDISHHGTWLPYDFRATALLNEPGYMTAVNRNPGALFVARPTEPPLPLRKIPEKPVVGVATNASFRAGQTELGFLKALAASMGVETLQLRLHPNSRLTQSDFHGAPITVAPSDESMKDFAPRIDVALVGNSASQIWLLRNGVPVVHVAGMDPHGFDLYGYCKQGFVFGERSTEQLSIKKLNEFYQNKNHYEILCRYTTLETQRLEELPSLKGLLSN
jgi:hypothetical protein